MKTSESTSLLVRLVKPLLATAAVTVAMVTPARAQGSINVTVAIDATKQGSAYPANFTGLSFEQGEMKPNNGVTGFTLDTNATQSPKCNQVIKLCTNMGLKHIRIGGGSVEMNKFSNTSGFTVPTGYDYNQAGVTALFNFAQAVGAKVTFSTRLLGSSTYDPLTDSVNCSAFAWNNYSTLIDSLAVGNEPNFHSYHTYTGHAADPEIYETNTTAQAPGSAYPSYAHNVVGNPVDGVAGEWKEFANLISTTVTGTPSFAGPDTGDEGTSTTTWWNNGVKNVSWTQAMVEDKKSGNITVPFNAALTHYYVGGGLASTGDAILDMLSSGWVTTNYPQQYNAITKPVSTNGYKYRLSECNEFLGDVDPNCETFAAALWALDFMHWQAANDSNCAGVNFHNKFGIFTATLYSDASGNWHTYPRSAAFKMFNLGTTGNKMTGVTVTKSSAANVNCYAVGNATDLYVTVVNKTSIYTSDDTSAVTKVAPTGFTAAHAYYIKMDSSPSANDVTQGEATVGGSSVNNNSANWAGTWTSVSVVSNTATVTVNPASAAIIHLTTY